MDFWNQKKQKYFYSGKKKLQEVSVVNPSPRKKSKSKAVLKAEPIPSGWDTTDEDEIRRRQLRAETAPMKVTILEEGGESYFNTYDVQGITQSYHVEILSLIKPLNSCSCADYEGNGLGTCKHIEKVLLTLRKKGKRKFKAAGLEGSKRIEIYVDPSDHQIKIQWPHVSFLNLDAYAFLKDFFLAQGTLMADIKTAVPVFLRHIEEASMANASIRSSIRVSKRVQSVLTDSCDVARKEEAKEFLLKNAKDGKFTLDITKLPLYDYQKDGMLHLACLEKAILADEMGLGKTVQAIAAAALLRKTKGIKHVLVVTPTSLKTEWEEQITKFVSLPSLLIYGNRAARLQQYQQDTFFYLANYEQVVRDHADIQRIIAPDIVILDEAQRIKNWRTKTAAAIKQLVSPYAFVLTGTPIENKIDDIYSIVQFLDPKLFGSLFRFNRDFYQLDDSGKAIGYKNLHLLHKRLKPIVLRRLKRDVEEQLPERTINTCFVPMSAEQVLRYEEQEITVSRLAATARKRPLTEEEFQRLQKALASMRMLCDTPYILDERCCICPKLEELEPILEELLCDNTTKIIIFSEWQRMLVLVRRLLEKMNIGYAWHTGSIDQKQRRAEINRFKEESADEDQCRVFLSTDCGSVGLNLQAANVVINLDLPWNPAKLEQRIARAWRKHQTRTVQVINFVSEDTIEHRMLSVLDIKQRLADNVLDLGTVEVMDMPSGRKAFMDQLEKIMGATASSARDHAASPVYNKEVCASDLDQQQQGTPVLASHEAGLTSENIPQEDPLIRFGQEVLARFQPRLHQLAAYEDHNGIRTIFAVVDGELAHPREQMHDILRQMNLDNAVRLEVLDRTAFETIQRLCSAGILSFNQDKTKTIYRSE